MPIVEGEGPRIRLRSQDMVPKKIPVLTIDDEPYYGFVYGARMPGDVEAEALEAWSDGNGPDGTPHSKPQRRRALQGVVLALVEGVPESYVRMMDFRELLEVLYDLNFLVRPDPSPETATQTNGPTPPSAARNRKARTTATFTPPLAPATGSATAT